MTVTRDTAGQSCLEPCHRVSTDKSREGHTAGRGSVGMLTCEVALGSEPLPPEMFYLGTLFPLLVSKLVKWTQRKEHGLECRWYQKIDRRCHIFKKPQKWSTVTEVTQWAGVNSGLLKTEKSVCKRTWVQFSSITESRRAYPCTPHTREVKAGRSEV